MTRPVDDDPKQDEATQDERKQDGPTSGDGPADDAAGDDATDGASKEGYEVGYGKPPIHARFKPGQSGNPRGRPRGARGLRAELEAELSERVRISENGRSRRVNMLKVVVKALVAKAAKGDPRAISKLIDLMLTLYGADGDQAAARPLSESDEKILAEYLAQGRAESDDGEDVEEDGDG